MEQKLNDAASKLPETSLDFHTIQSTFKKKSNIKILKVVASLAACLLLLISIGFVTVETKEYNDAIDFFNEYALPKEGLNRGEIKAVYRDISTRSFTYAKTAEVITNSLSSDQIGGYEIIQENLTPEDIENLWNYKNHSGETSTPDQPGINNDITTFSPENEQPSASADSTVQTAEPSVTDGLETLKPSPTALPTQTSRPATHTATSIPTPSPTAPVKWKLYANGHDMTVRCGGFDVDTETGILEIPITAAVNCLGGILYVDSIDRIVQINYQDFTFTFDASKEYCGYPLVTSADKSLRKYKNGNFMVEYESAVEFLKLIDATISVDYDAKTINVQAENSMLPQYTATPSFPQDPLDYSCKLVINGVDISEQVYVKMDAAERNIEFPLTAFIEEIGGTILSRTSFRVSYMYDGKINMFDLTKSDYGIPISPGMTLNEMVRKVVDGDVIVDYVAAVQFCRDYGYTLRVDYVNRVINVTEGIQIP